MTYLSDFKLKTLLYFIGSRMASGIACRTSRLLARHFEKKLRVFGGCLQITENSVKTRGLATSSLLSQDIIKSPYNDVEIPEISMHELLLTQFKEFKDLDAIVSSDNMLLLNRWL